MLGLSIPRSTFDTPLSEPLASVPDSPENHTEQPLHPVVESVAPSEDAIPPRPASRILSAFVTPVRFVSRSSQR